MINKSNLFFVSFLSTNYGALADHWKKYSKLKDEGKRGSDRPFRGNLGGKISLIDWNSQKIIWEKYLASPSGIVYSNGVIYVNSIEDGKILLINYPEGSIIGEINHPHFNKPHSLVKTKNGFLVSSTGLDTIIEIDLSGNTLYEFFLTEHGYNKDQFGNQREIDKKINHQKIVYPSLNHTTHVNYARYIDREENLLLASLFHPGEIVLINKKSNSLKVVLKNLNHPHSLHDFSNSSYLICDTANNQVLEVDKASYAIKDKITGPFSWVQDAVKVDTSLYVADADNHRIAKIDLTTKTVVGYFNFSKNDRLYQLIPVTI